MSLKYLNLSGLEDLWINIKNYILSKIPTKTSELTNDSGYLTSHQSLANYVDRNTTQTITAIKVITGGNQGKMVFKNPNYTKGDAVESGTTISRLYFGNGTSYATVNGVLTTDINSAGNTSMELCAMNNTASNSNRASLILTYDKSATRPRILKSWGDFIPYSNNNYTLGNTSNIWKECYSNAYYLGSTAFGDIVTHNASEFLTSHQSLSSCVKNVVTNNQTIKSTGITRGTAPSSAQTFGIAFSDNNDKYIGNIYGQYATNKSTYVGLYAYKGTTTANSDNVSVQVGYDASGNAYTYAPTPATSDNSTQIATTAFVKAQGYLTSHQSLANYVTTNTAQDIEGNKNFKGLLTTIPNDTLWAVTASTTDDITYLGANAIHVEQKSSGKLTDLSGGAWSVAELGVGCFFFRINNGTDIRYKHLGQNTVNRIPVVSGANRFINDVTPNANNTYSLGTSGLQWKNAYAVNIYENGTALSSKYAQIDNISANGIGTTRLLAYDAERYNTAGDAKPGSSLYDVSMKLHNSIGYYGDFSSGSGEFRVAINAHGTQSGTWKLLHTVSVDAPQDGARSFTIGMWVRIA